MPTPDVAYGIVAGSFGAFVMVPLFSVSRTSYSPAWRLLLPLPEPGPGLPSHELNHWLGGSCLQIEADDGHHGCFKSPSCLPAALLKGILYSAPDGPHDNQVRQERVAEQFGPGTIA